MPPHEHDRRPDPTLILQGVCHVQPSKHGLGNDYPITPLDSEELKDRDKSKRMIEIFFFLKLTFTHKATPAICTSNNDASFDNVRLRWKRVQVKLPMLSNFVF